MSYLLLFLLFGLPFVYLSSGPSLTEIPKVLAAELVIIIAFILQIFKQGIPWDIDSRLKYPVIAVLALSLFGLIFHFREYTFFGNPIRLQGTFLVWCTLLLAIISAKVNFKIPDKLILTVSALFLISFFVFGTDENSRFAGSLGDPNLLAIYLLFLWPLLLPLFNSKPEIFKILEYLMVALVVVLILLTGSRSAFIGLAIQIFFLGAWEFKFLSSKLAVAVSILVIGLSLILPFASQLSGFADRAEIWQSSLIAGMYQPLLGSGFGNAEYVIKEASLTLPGNLKNIYVESPSNLLLDWFIEGGIVGLGLLITLLALTFVNLQQNGEWAKTASLLGILAGALFNPLSAAIIMPLWWLIGSSFLKNELPAPQVVPPSVSLPNPPLTSPPPVTSCPDPTIAVQ